MLRAFLLSLVVFLAASALTQAADPPPPNKAELDQLAETLADPAQRDKLITQLHSLAAQQQAARDPAALPLKVISNDFDKNTARLVQRINRSVQPWMWWVAGLLWAAMVALVGKLLERGFAKLFPGAQASWLGRTFRVFCYIVCALIAVYFFLHAFGAALFAGPLLQVERKLVLLAGAFGIADLALLMLNLGIDRYLERTDAEGQKVEHSPRVRTLLPLLRNVIMLTLGMVLALVVLGEFGVNIAPLLAGAGVVGVAVGLGAQKLVQDVITGAFMLFENTIAVGDTVRIADHTGIVEGLTIRAVRLRDAQGLVHTLPFSTVSTVVNMSREFGYFPFEVNITYESDIDRALALIGEAAAEIAVDPVVNPDILAPAEIYGVERLGEWSVVLSGRIKTLPNRQQAVARAFNRRIKEKFAAAGIVFAQSPKLFAMPRV